GDGRALLAAARSGSGDGTPAVASHAPGCVLTRYFASQVCRAPSMAPTAGVPGAAGHRKQVTTPPEQPPREVHSGHDGGGNMATGTAQGRHASPDLAPVRRARKFLSVLGAFFVLIALYLQVDSAGVLDYAAVGLGAI